MASENQKAYDIWWNDNVLTPPNAKTYTGFSPAKTARALGRGFYEPIEQGALLLNKAAALTGIPYLERQAQEQEARIKAREERYAEAQQGGDYSGAKFIGNVISPAPIAAGVGAGRAVSGPALKALIEGGVGGLFAPSDAENYWADKGTQAMFGSMAGLGTRAVGGVMNPELQPYARELMDKGVVLSPEMATTGHTRDFMHAAETIKGLMGTGGKTQGLTNTSFNNALANDILGPLDLSTSGLKGHALVQDMSGKISGFYDDAYKKLGTVLPDQQFMSAIALANSKAAKSMDKATYNKFVQMLDRDVIGRFDIRTKNQGKAIQGEELKNMRSYFQDTLKRAKESKDSDRFDNVKLTQSLQEVKDAIFDYTDRVDQTGLVRRANKAWAEKSVFEAAAAKQPTTGVFDINDLEASISSLGDPETTSKGVARLQEKAIPYLSTMKVDSPNPYVMARRAGVLGTMAAGSAYAMWTNPAVGSAILAAAGISPWVIQRMMRNPSQARKAISSAVKKLGPSAVANITQQIAQEQAAKDRQTLRELSIPEYQNIE